MHELAGIDAVAVPDDFGVLLRLFGVSAHRDVEEVQGFDIFVGGFEVRFEKLPGLLKHRNRNQFLKQGRFILDLLKLPENLAESVLPPAHFLSRHFDRVRRRFIVFNEGLNSLRKRRKSAGDFVHLSRERSHCLCEPFNRRGKLVHVDGFKILRQLSEFAELIYK